MKKFIIIISIFITLIVLYGFFINPYQLTQNNYTITSSKLSQDFDGFKISHFSDLLLGSTKTVNDLEEIVKTINEEKPDIIVFTGDLISQEYKPSNKEVDEIKDILKKLDCTLYKYAVIGDNDAKNLNLYKDIMLEADFQILDNSSTYLFYKNQEPIEIVGITNIDNINSAYLNEEGITPSYYLILTHYPDYANDISNYPSDLILAGHSLGGQIKLPLFDGIIKKEHAKTYINDMYDINNKKLYISNGLGCEYIKFRLFNTPAINNYILKNN